MQVVTKRPQDQTTNEWLEDWEDAFTQEEFKEVMADFSNVSKFGPKDEAQAKKMNWHRIDCLAAYLLRKERDSAKLRAWFASQDEEWQAARKARFMARLRG